jgi:hypothetical protein
MGVIPNQLFGCRTNCSVTRNYAERLVNWLGFAIVTPFPRLLKLLAAICGFLQHAVIISASGTRALQQKTLRSMTGVMDQKIQIRMHVTAKRTLAARLFSRPASHLLGRVAGYVEIAAGFWRVDEAVLSFIRK